MQWKIKNHFLTKKGLNMQILSLLVNIKNEVVKSKSLIMSFGVENLGSIDSLIREVEMLRDENDQMRMKIFKMQNKG